MTVEKRDQSGVPEKLRLGKKRVTSRAALGSLSVGLNPSEFTRPCSERARLEESGSQSHLSILTPVIILFSY